MSPTTVVMPTARQMSYLRSLALKTGTSFTYPRTRGEASREINRLRGLKDTRRDAALERDEGERERFAYATGVQDEEVSGYGSTATWRTSAPPRSAAAPRERTAWGSAPSSHAMRSPAGSGCSTGSGSTGRSGSPTGPPAGRGRSYLVERELEKDGYSALKALIADYIAQARELDRGPDGQQRHPPPAPAGHACVTWAAPTDRLPSLGVGGWAPVAPCGPGPWRFSHAARALGRGNGPHPAGHNKRQGQR